MTGERQAPVAGNLEGIPVGWVAARHAFYVRPGVWRAGYVLRPDPTVDFFSEPLEELRAELRSGLERFRAECAPRVGPQVTCRGAVVSESVVVPVDPPVYLRHRFKLAAEACKRGFRKLGAAVESFRRSFREAFDREQ